MIFRTVRKTLIIIITKTRVEFVNSPVCVLLVCCLVAITSSSAAAPPFTYPSLCRRPYITVAETLRSTCIITKYPCWGDGVLVSQCMSLLHRVQYFLRPHTCRGHTHQVQDGVSIQVRVSSCVDISRSNTFFVPVQQPTNGHSH